MRKLFKRIIILFNKNKFKSMKNYIKVMKSCKDKKKIDMLRFKCITKMIRYDFESDSEIKKKNDKDKDKDKENY